MFYSFLTLAKARETDSDSNSKIIVSIVSSSFNINCMTYYSDFYKIQKIIAI